MCVGDFIIEDVEDVVLFQDRTDGVKTGVNQDKEWAEFRSTFEKMVESSEAKIRQDMIVTHETASLDKVRETVLVDMLAALHPTTDSPGGDCHSLEEQPSLSAQCSHRNKGCVRYKDSSTDTGDTGQEETNGGGLIPAHSPSSRSKPVKWYCTDFPVAAAVMYSIVHVLKVSHSIQCINCHVYRASGIFTSLLAVF